ncbi:MAG: SDR family NAD(P)-dependent oxidoreductase [Hyphomicrobiaceae bacterium]
MQLTMTGRKALITGGSLGIGRAIATRFAEAGAHVAIVARRESVLEEAREHIQSVGNSKVIPIAADVSTAEGCLSAHEEAVARLGSIDVLVNNAGTSKRGAFEELSDEVWQTDLDLKLFAAIRLSRLALPGMRDQRWGRIINVLNTGAKAPPPEGAPTAVSRAAGMALTKILAGEGAPHNILVNAVLVGRIKSDQWIRRHTSEDSDRSIEEFYQDMSRNIPLGRVGGADEFANVVCFLASNAGSYVTGTAINVDGGMCPIV